MLISKNEKFQQKNALNSTDYLMYRTHTSLPIFKNKKQEKKTKNKNKSKLSGRSIKKYIILRVIWCKQVKVNEDKKMLFIQWNTHEATYHSFNI